MIKIIQLNPCLFTPILTSFLDKEVTDFVNTEKFKKISHDNKIYDSNSSEFKNFKPANLFIDMNKIIETSGEGIYHYYWLDSAREKDVGYEKIAYVKLFEPLGLVIGTGNFIDYFNLALKEQEVKIQSNYSSIFRDLLISALLLIIVILIASYFIIEKRIGKTLKMLAEGMQEIEQGNWDYVFDYMSKDEMGYIAFGARHLCRAQKRKIEMSEKISQGDLTVSAEVRTEKDKFGKILCIMLDNLRTLIGMVKTAASGCIAHIDDIKLANSNLVEETTKLAAAFEEMSASMIEINNHASNNAKNANLTKNLACEMQQSTEKGKQNIDAMVVSMQSIYDSSKQISSINKVIDEIAFQTNLLALNAAVEAARAGVHGKGFAVVADEVRNLANRSSSAAKETAELIDKSGQIIENGKINAIHSSESFKEIITQIEKVTELVSKIAGSSSEQAEAIHEISKGLEQIQSIAERNNDLAEQNISRTELLTSNALNLVNSVDKFKLLPQ